MECCSRREATVLPCDNAAPLREFAEDREVMKQQRSRAPSSTGYQFSRAADIEKESGGDSDLQVDVPEMLLKVGRVAANSLGVVCMSGNSQVHPTLLAFSTVMQEDSAHHEFPM
jgi:hypothetical protein